MLAQKYAVSSKYTCCRTQRWLAGHVLGRRSIHSEVHSARALINQAKPSSRNIAVPRSFQSQMTKNGGISAEAAKKRAERALLIKMQQEVLWEGTIIDNSKHPLISHILRLSQNRKYRNANQMMCVGGQEMIRELCEKGCSPDHLLIPSGTEVPKWARQCGTEIVSVSRSVMNTCFSGSDGYIGDFRIPDQPPKEQLIANKQQMERVLVFDNVNDPGNLGTMLRTAAGFQYDAVILSNHCADLYDNRVIRAARGAHFQTAVPFYSLSEEDGDDVEGMLNHIIQRNNLAPLLFTGKPDTKQLYPSELTMPSLPLRQKYHPEVRPISASEEKLSDFCLEHFARDNATQQGYMLLVTPNNKGVAKRQLSQRISRKLTTLLLDYPTVDFLSASAVVLHALRPKGEWDYLPANTTGDPRSSCSMGLATGSVVNIGPERLDMGYHHLNLDEREQKEEANFANELKKWRRFRKRQGSDYDFWMDNEVSRVKHLMKASQQRMKSPWESGANNWKSGTPEWVPNIIDEYRQSPGRDYLQNEAEKSSQFVRPSNYD